MLYLSYFQHYHLAHPDLFPLLDCHIFHLFHFHLLFPIFHCYLLFPHLFLFYIYNFFANLKDSLIVYDLASDLNIELYLKIYKGVIMDVK